MKTKIHLSTTKAFALAFCSFCLFVICLLSCNKESSLIQTTTTDEEQADLKCGLIFKTGDILHLSGNSLYKTWKMKGGAILQDIKFDCVADLEFLENHKFRFTWTEIGTGKTDIACYGKMTPSGILTFTYPVPVVTLPDGTGLNITDIIKAHSCATIWGNPGIKDGTLVFTGKFNGKKFTASAYFKAKIEVECPSNDMFPTPVDGSLLWTFGYDLAVVN